MGFYVKDLVSGMTLNPIQYKVSATLTEGAVVMREATATDPGEVEIASTTAALNCMGCALDTGTYSTVQGATEGLVRLNPQPFALWKFRISGTSVQGAALTATTPAQILTNDTAETAGTTIAETSVGTINMERGLVKGRTGANAGTIRKIAAHTNNTSLVVTVPFPNDIAAGDTFIRVPWSRTAIAVQMVATTIDEANGAIADETGIPFDVHDVIIDEENDQAWVIGTFRTAKHNSLA